MAASNGLVDLRDFSIVPHTPLYFSPYALSYPFDRQAPRPVAWEKFLSEIWPDDPQSIHELQKWFGYMLTIYTSQQKMFLLIGPPRSGKGTIARVLTKLIGEGNIAFPTLASLATNFGLSALIGKAAAVISDARMVGKPSDCSAIVERILNITGEDSITIDRKHKDPTTHRLPTRITILANEAPNFRDVSGAIAVRSIFLKFSNQWVGREDLELTKKLWDELPGILLWAVEGRRMLAEDGKFILPESATNVHQTFEDASSPIKRFVDSACDIRTTDERLPADLGTVPDFFDAYREWCRKSGCQCGSDNIFSRDLQAAYPSIIQERPRVRVDDGMGNIKEDRSRRFRGISLSDDGLALQWSWRQRDHPRGAVAGAESEAHKSPVQGPVQVRSRVSA